MVDEIFRIKKIVSVMMAIFQDGGQTVNYRSKRYKESIEGLHLRYKKIKHDGNWTTRSRDITDFLFNTINVTSKTAIF